MSQRHRSEIYGINSRGVQLYPLTTLLPVSATLANVGAAARTIATFTAAGPLKGGYVYGPVKWSVKTPAGVSAAFTGNVLKTTANPAHASTGAKVMTVTATDGNGKSKDLTFTLTLT